MWFKSISFNLGHLGKLTVRDKFTISRKVFIRWLQNRTNSTKASFLGKKKPKYKNPTGIEAVS